MATERTILLGFKGDKVRDAHVASRYQASQSQPIFFRKVNPIWLETLLPDSNHVMILTDPVAFLDFTVWLLTFRGSTQ